MKSYAKPSHKYPPKKGPSGSGPESPYSGSATIQSKIVLLTLTFPRLRIIWSSSPFATSEIFNDLKLNNSEPDATKAIAMGTDDDPEAGAGVNGAAEEVLRCLPGISAKNVKYVMGKVGSLREFGELDVKVVHDILGVQPWKVR